jgi:hypothetical protein
VKEESHLEDLCIHGRIILKSILIIYIEDVGGLTGHMIGNSGVLL